MSAGLIIGIPLFMFLGGAILLFLCSFVIDPENYRINEMENGEFVVEECRFTMAGDMWLEESRHTTEKKALKRVNELKEKDKAHQVKRRIDLGQA